MTLSKRKLSRLLECIWIGGMNATLLPLSRLVPRQADRWLFTHQGGLFAGNSRYLFLWMAIYRPDIHVTWLAENEETRRLITDSGMVAHRRWSPKGVVASLRSSVFVYCHTLSDINIPLSGGAMLLNLWHGVGIKATMLGDKTGIMSHYQKYETNPLARMVFYEYLKKPDIVATTSDFMQSHFSSQFEIPFDHCPQLGYSRLDASSDTKLRKKSEEIDQSQGFRFNPSGFKEVYIYMPTWRDTGRPFLEDALPDLDRLSAVLRERDALLYVKLHPRTADVWPGDMRNIVLWPGETEVYTYLHEFDSLITDYSSILYDFIFVKNAGILLYTFDYEKYLSVDHSILYPFDENTAGRRVNSFDELCRAIEDGSVVEPCPNTAVIREKFWEGCDVPASPGIIDYVEKMLEAPRVSRLTTDRPLGQT